MRSKNLDALLKEAQRRTNAVTKNVIVPAAIQAEIAAIHEAVYQHHSPTIYKRRGGAGGMLDPNNFRVSMHQRSKVYALENVTPFNGEASYSKPVSHLIYGGDGYEGLKYTYPKKQELRSAANYPYLAPRDFITPTKETLRGTLSSLYARGMRSAGLRVKE